MINEQQIAQYERDGAVMLPGLFGPEWVDRLRHAIERRLADEQNTKNSQGFSRSMGMWQIDPDFRAFVYESPAAQIAAEMMRSRTARLYFDHLFVKEPGTVLPTPWHQDMPYWPVRGGKVVSIWLALDDVTTKSSGLIYVRGSHQGGKTYRPVSFEDGKADDNNLRPGEEAMPDIDGDPTAFDLLCWDMKPGDCLIHHGYVIHGASENRTASTRRRALSTRWADEDVRYDPRPGKKMDLFDPPGLKAGDALSEEHFPLIWNQL